MDAVTNAIQDFDADNIVKNALTTQIDEHEYSYKKVNNRNVLVTTMAATSAAFLLLLDSYCFK